MWPTAKEDRLVHEIAKELFDMSISPSARILQHK
jgi:hypothetical protein